MTTTIDFQNPLGVDSVLGLLNAILNNFLTVIVVLALVFLVIGAILYITSAGDEKRITTAKGAITAAMIGLTIGIAAPSFLKEIINTLCPAGSTSVFCTTANAASSADSLTEIALRFLNFLLSIVGILAMIMMVVGGIMYFKSGGNEKDSETAKKIVVNAIIGISIALASLIIVNQVAKFFA